MKNKLAGRDRGKIVRSLLGYFVKEENAGQREVLEEWLSSGEKNKALFDRLNDKGYVQKGMKEFQGYDSREGWEKVKGKISARHRRLLSRWSYAASVIILLGVGIAVWNVFPGEGNESLVIHAALQEDIAPGCSRAVLVLESGETIFLGQGQDSLTRGVVGENFMNDGERLVYSDAVEEKAKIHTLQVPRGGEYTLCLSDGTMITLNANSKIQYPDRFSGGERWVELEGEAYFEVTGNESQPFRVTCGDSRISVLGTKFNIMAYDGQKDVVTTLVNGRVQVFASGDSLILNPGEQSLSGASGIDVRKVDAGIYIAWISGIFEFEEMSLGEITGQLERWYDVSFVYTDSSLREITFTGAADRHRPLNVVLEMIEKLSGVRFELGKEVITIYKE